MALVALSERRMTIAGNKRLLIGTATLASGTNHIQTGLRVILQADVTPVNDAAATGQTVLCKHDTAGGTEGDALESGFLTVESAEAIAYNFMVWGW